MEEVFLRDQKNLEIPLPQIFARFADLQGRSYLTTQRDREVALALLQDGYAIREILAGLERVAANLGGSLKTARTFAYCVPEIRKFPPGSPHAMPESDFERSLSGPPPNANHSTSEQVPNYLVPGSIPEHVLTVFAQAVGRVPSPAEWNRLVWLFEEFSPAAQAVQENAWSWIEDALKKSPPDARQPVAYARAILSRRVHPKGRSSQKSAASPLGHGEVTNLQETTSQTSENLLLAPRKPVDAPITVAGLMIEKPKSRKSGYVLPGELAMGYLYDFMKNHEESGEESEDGYQ